MELREIRKELEEELKEVQDGKAEVEEKYREVVQKVIRMEMEKMKDYQKHQEELESLRQSHSAEVQ